MIDADFKQGEIDAMAMHDTLSSPGWKVIDQHLRRMVAEGTTRLRKGGKEQHERNEGFLNGVETVIAKAKDWRDQAQAFIEKERA